ncbi:MAG: SpoIIE family protein phosphatase [Leptospiraceae bacterium]|nr:SpoIIE family protein phosphatase [Leptospiraceae bacterium]
MRILRFVVLLALPVVGSSPALLAQAVAANKTAHPALYAPRNKIPVISTSEIQADPARYRQLGTKMQILKDPSGTLSWPAIQTMPQIDTTETDTLNVGPGLVPLQWQPTRTAVPNFTFDPAVYWIRFQVVNDSANIHKLLLEVAHPLHDYIDVYMPGQSKLTIYQTGDRRAVSTRALFHPHFLFPVSLAPGASQTVYLRFASADGLLEPMDILLWQDDSFEHADFFRTLVWWLTAVSMASLAIYHLFVFLVLRDRSYLYASLYMLSGALFSMVYTGLAPLVFWPDSPWWTNQVHVVLIGGKVISLGLFARNYLGLSVIGKRWDTAFLTLVALGTLLIIFGLVLPFSQAIRVAILISFSNYFFLMIAGGFFSLRGNRPARYFMAALGSYFAGSLLLILKSAELLPSVFLTENASRMGGMMAVLLLSFGLADRIQLIRREREEARTKALESERKANNVLQQSNADLRRLDQLKDEFLANTSHELRTPLNGIIGISESLLAGATGPLSVGAQENLRLVAASGRRLAHLVNDVLDLSRLQHNDMVLQQRPVDLNVIISQVLTFSRPLVAEKQLELIFEREDLPPVYVDENRIEQVLYNLIDNAIKFTKQGVVIISATVAATDRDDFQAATFSKSFNSCIQITVADTGIGIPTDKQEQIFESFSQADGSIGREYGGTGLGLSISRQLVRLHGGELWVDSTPGEGAHFHFTVPIAETAAFASDRSPQPGTEAAAKTLEQPGIQSSEITAETSPPNDKSAAEQIEAADVELPTPVKTLIVDDDPVNLRVLHNNLRLQGHTIVEARNGKEALDLMDKQGPFDMILLDVMMPGLSGYEVCRIAREQYSESELPIIMLTARNQVADVRTGLDSGANDYLIKPFHIDELNARVRTMLRLKEAARNQSHLAVLHTELELAHKMQRSLLPTKTPRVNGLKTAVRYRSMLKVGGDYYDLVQDHAGLGVLMADVSGHGIAAALIVSIVKIAFWFERSHLMQPELLFDGMNKALQGNIGDQFVTACFVYIDPEKRILRTANAGHPPILVLRSKDQETSLIELRPFGRLLGPFPDGKYAGQELALQSGDRVLLYTDGAFEIANAAGEQFGLDRLRSFLLDTVSLNADDFADQLLAAIIAWGGSESRIDDDIALLVIDVLP